MLEVNFRFVKNTEVLSVIKEGSKPKDVEVTLFAIQIKEGWLGKFKYQYEGKQAVCVKHKTKEEGIAWLFKQYDLKPSAMAVYQHATIKLL